MKKRSKTALFAYVVIVLCSITASVKAAEVAHGTWSEESRILSVRSYWSFTIFKLDTTQSCGNTSEGWWRLNTSVGNADMQLALQYKKSILLAAATSSKIVQLRCENGAISDLLVEFNE